MKSYVLVFVPGTESFLALWAPQSTMSWRVQTVPPGNQAGNALLQQLDMLLQDAQISLSVITHIGVMAGPASYTQLRVFIATANALAWSLNLPLFGFGPEVELPDALPELIRTARLNQPIEPIYPTQIL